MEYEDGVVEPIMGAYYATPSKDGVMFNYFREEELLNYTHLLKPENEELENLVLKDNNIVAIKYTDEFKLNKNYETPTNRIITSLLSRERLAFFLQFGITYVERTNREGKIVIEKHIMRYPQFFASRAITHKLDEGLKKELFGTHKEVAKRLWHITM